MSEMACQLSEWKTQFGPSFCDSRTSRVEIALPSVMEEIPPSTQRVTVPVPRHHPRRQCFMRQRQGSESSTNVRCGVHLTRACSVSCASAIYGVHLTRAGSVSCASAAALNSLR